MFDDDALVIDFNNLAAIDGKFGIIEALHERAFHDELENSEGGRIDGVISNFAEFFAFFGLNAVVYEVEIEVDNF